MKAYSNDLRRKIIEAYQKKEGSLRKLAKRFAVSFSFVWRLESVSESQAWSLLNRMVGDLNLNWIRSI